MSEATEKAVSDLKKIYSILLLLGFIGVGVLFYFFFDFSSMRFKNRLSDDLRDGTHMSVHFINVGAADGMYINCGDVNVVIDAGDFTLTNTALEYLERQGVHKLDLAICSHPHLDHIGGMPDILRKMKVDRFIMPILPDNILPVTKSYNDILDVLQSKSIKVEQPIAGDTFSIGEMKFEIFAPLNDYDNVNNYSVVVKVSFGKVSFLFTGDAQEESEHDMLSKGYDLSADVLKVGHHGSKTSTSGEFLKKVSPKYAVISSAPEPHGHPHKVIVNRLTDAKVNVLRTDTEGTIVCTTDGENIKVTTEQMQIK